MKSQNSTTIELKDGERIDDLQRNGYGIIQNPEKFCFGMDAVLLSGFCQVKKGERVLDIGTGTGILPILLSAKTEGAHFTGIEVQEESADMAKRSVAMNGLSERIDILCEDINKCSGVLKPESFQVVVSNPPYMIGTHGLKCESDQMTIARHEILCTLEDVIREGSRVLKDKGRFYMVHRPFRLVEIFDTFRRYHMEPKRMRLVYPYVDKEPNMVLIEALKGGRSRLTVEKPLIVFESKGKYTREITDLYGY
ncbi:MAG: tRNA1(Val) (adenine(37)-N6)-methyltransferase [Lachnospiraceae bacterium]|nr:tRNA1(Val) (adenine(37)-N6)-methyltransferase [Lachnospiraceae bacterium]